MGNSIGAICGYTQDKNNELNYMGKKSIEHYKKQENLEKVKSIQHKYREIKSKQKLKENVKTYERNFDSNLNTIGIIIPEEEFENSIDHNVREIQKILGPLSINVQEYKQKYKSVFSKPPIKFQDEGTIYKGDWNYQGKKHGFGILITKEGCRYEGFWKNDQLDGLGRFIEKRGNYYDGNWSNGMAHGHGTLHVAGSSKYVGNWVYDVQEGFAEEYYEDGTIYSGNFKGGAKHGKGVMKWADGCYYEGDFENSFISGKGVYYWTDGRIYSGEWLENRMHGFGTFIWPDGKRYEGNYINDKKHGLGKYYWSPNIYYEGNWVNAKQHGIGICHTSDRIIKGEFRSGRMIRIVSEEKINQENFTLNPSNNQKNLEQMDIINKLNMQVDDNFEKNDKEIDTKITPINNNVSSNQTKPKNF